MASTSRESLCLAPEKEDRDRAAGRGWGELRSSVSALLGATLVGKHANTEIMIAQAKGKC